MKTLIFPTILIGSLLFSPFVHARDVFKRYIDLKEVKFLNGHFIVYMKNGDKTERFKLKVLRVNNAGPYYTPRDVCTRKHLHRDHDTKERQKSMGGKLNVQSKSK